MCDTAAHTLCANGDDLEACQAVRSDCAILHHGIHDGVAELHLDGHHNDGLVVVVPCVAHFGSGVLRHLCQHTGALLCQVHSPIIPRVSMSGQDLTYLYE